ncbi:hypothetical protein [Staphylococcus saprophyticus]|nr:hypothetical protein [Staphylococcus saprophyticus]
MNRREAQGGYNRWKGGVIMFRKSLGSEWGEDGIGVNCIGRG